MRLRMGKAPKSELERIRRFFDELEEINHESDDIEKLGEFIYSWLQSPNFSIERVLMGYQVLIDNACDPSLDYLDFKPEIKDAINAFEKTKQLNYEAEDVTKNGVV